MPKNCYNCGLPQRPHDCIVCNTVNLAVDIIDFFTTFGVMTIYFRK